MYAHTRIRKRLRGIPADLVSSILPLCRVVDSVGSFVLPDDSFRSFFLDISIPFRLFFSIGLFGPTTNYHDYQMQMFDVVGERNFNFVDNWVRYLGLTDLGPRENLIDHAYFCR